MTECEVTEIVSYILGMLYITHHNQNSMYSVDDCDGFVETLEAYGNETGASEDIDVEWTFDTIKKMIMTLVTYYTLEKV